MTQVFKSEFLNIIKERGFIKDCTNFNLLDERLKKSSIRGYIGFDCTADSLHVGSLIPIMMLRWFQKTGNQPIILLGGGTTKIGDPSGKNKSRKILTDQEIEKNLSGISRVFSKFLNIDETTESGNNAIMVNNISWLQTLNLIDFLRDVGKHFTINNMLTFDSVRSRLDKEEPLSFLEFNYMIFQAFDFMKLNELFDCTLQMGGSDQWGNIVNGIDLGRKIRNVELVGLTTPLLVSPSGEKMGKTESGAVWLDSEKFTPFDYWQFWRNIPDSDVGRMLRLFTELPIDEINRLETLRGQEINEAKKILASEATSLCHGSKASFEAGSTAKNMFEDGISGIYTPTFLISQNELRMGINVVDLFVKANLGKTKSEIRRLINGNGAKVNNMVIDDEKMIVSDENMIDGSIKLSSGRKNHVVIKISD